MSPDFVACLGSRATAPGEVRSDWDLTAYAARLARDDASEPVDASETVGAAVSRRLHDPRLGRLDPDRLRQLLVAMARPPTAELNQARLAAAAGMPATTVGPYVDAAVELGFVRLLPGSRAAVTKRAIGRPRVVFTDPALAAHLAGDTPARLIGVDARSRLAPYLTGMVADELLRQQATSAVDFRVGHLRERNGLAVDLVVELPDDTVYGLEVRTAASLRPHQFGGLAALASRAGWRMRGGIVLNTAPVGHHYRTDLWGLPISSVWDWDQGAGT